MKKNLEGSMFSLPGLSIASFKNILELCTQNLSAFYTKRIKKYYEILTMRNSEFV